MRFPLLIAALLAGTVAPLAAQSTSKDSAAVLAVVDAFHAAMTAGNAAGLMQLVAPDAVFLEEIGVEQAQSRPGRRRRRCRVGDIRQRDGGNVSGPGHRLHGYRADGAEPRDRRLADQGRPLVVASPPKAGPEIT